MNQFLYLKGVFKKLHHEEHMLADLAMEDIQVVTVTLKKALIPRYWLILMTLILCQYRLKK